jgi:hypothetical protein
LGIFLLGMFANHTAGSVNCAQGDSGQEFAFGAIQIQFYGSGFWVAACLFINLGFNGVRNFLQHLSLIREPTLTIVVFTLLGLAAWGTHLVIILTALLALTIAIGALAWQGHLPPHCWCFLSSAGCCGG